MYEYLSELPPNAVVLDLGSSSGSFDSSRYKFTTILIDVEEPRLFRNPGALNVCADMACLPLASEYADAVICNHSLEHVVNLGGALSEIGRVLKKSGFLFVSVPDASTLCDRLYRWLAKGGGHVNAFTDPKVLGAQIATHTRLTPAGTRPLFTSFSYLNRKNRTGKAPRKMLLLGGGNEKFLLLATSLLRLADRLLGTRYSVYGWALHFGRGPGDEKG
jgi:SAM-dependent methyltransferase